MAAINILKGFAILVHQSAGLTEELHQPYSVVMLNKSAGGGWKE